MTTDSPTGPDLAEALTRLLRREAEALIHGLLDAEATHLARLEGRATR